MPRCASTVSTRLDWTKAPRLKNPEAVRLLTSCNLRQLLLHLRLECFAAFNQAPWQGAGREECRSQKRSGRVLGWEVCRHDEKFQSKGSEGSKEKKPRRPLHITSYMHRYSVKA